MNNWKIIVGLGVLTSILGANFWIKEASYAASHPFDRGLADALTPVGIALLAAGIAIALIGYGQKS